MEMNIRHGDIGSRLCQRCGACCRIMIKIPKADSRYRRFLRQIGFQVHPPAEDGKIDCCEGEHEIQIDLGYCKHLNVSRDDRGMESFFCRLHGTPDLPEMCRDYTCVAWALTMNGYNDRNKVLVSAQTALNRLRVEDQEAQELR